MNLMLRPHLGDALIPGAASTVGFRLRRTISNKRYARVLISTMRRGTLLVALALLALIFLAARHQ